MDEMKLSIGDTYNVVKIDIESPNFFWESL